jgi:hypothetical protein
LGDKIKDTFEILRQVQEGKELPTEMSNELAQPLYTLVGAAAMKFKDSLLLEGTATTRNEAGHQVAVTKVMVSEDELGEWLERLVAARVRINQLLTSPQEWLTVSDSAVNDKFTFLRLSELP